MKGEAEAIITVRNKRGLHARAAAKLVQTAERFTAHIMVRRRPQQLSLDAPPAVSACSILGLMMLGAEQGAELLISATGKDAESALAAIAALTETCFGEEE